MAGESTGTNPAGRCGNQSDDSERGAQSGGSCQHGDRQTMLRAAITLLTFTTLLWLPQVFAAVAVSAARVWPAQDYTRLTLESRQVIRHNMFTVSDPERLVIDLEDVELGDTLNSLTRLVDNNDPYITSLRVGRFKPGVVRLVLDLKSEVKPQLFVLKPVGEYGYRLVLDVYPAKPPDPLMTLLEKIQAPLPEAASAPAATAAAEQHTAKEPPDSTASFAEEKLEPVAKPTIGKTDAQQPVAPARNIPE